MRQPTPGYRVVRRVVTTWARVEHMLERGLAVVRRAASGVLAEALDDDERRDLGPRVYDAWDQGRTQLPSLFAEERVWLAARLPPAPAHVLVGGAGAGREAAALAALGHRVAAFDPRIEGTERCRVAVAGQGVVLRASYEDLTAAVLDGSPGPASPLAQVRFDAVLLGWGSLAHVLDPDERRRVLVASHRLAPAGPVLGSYPGADAGLVFGGGRAESAGRRVGKALSRARHRRPGQPATFAPHCGFVATLTRDEIEGAALQLGRTVVWEPITYPHFTLLPPTGA